MISSRRLNIKLILIVVTALALPYQQPLLAAPDVAKKRSTGSKNSKSKKTKKNRKTPLTPLSQPESSDASFSLAPGSKQLTANVGLSPMPLIGAGATFGSLSARGSGMEFMVFLASGRSTTIAAQVSHVGARMRLPFGRFFYGAGGAGFRMAKGSWYVLNQTADAEYQAGSSLNAVTLDGAVGGQMKFGSLIVGADLVGVSYPVLKIGVKTKKPAEEDYDPDDADAQQAKFNKLAGGLTLTVAKVGIGFAF
jgi:hypothetical protein